MSTENRERVLTRLESGQDQQTKGRLRTTDGCMCFQGVVIDEYIQTTGEGAWVPFDDAEIPSVPFVRGSVRCTGWLPHDVETWSGLTSDEIMNATDENDQGVSFPEIAAKLRAGELA